jgi:hypothetical protein
MLYDQDIRCLYCDALSGSRIRTGASAETMGPAWSIYPCILICFCIERDRACDKDTEAISLYTHILSISQNDF